MIVQQTRLCVALASVAAPALSVAAPTATASASGDSLVQALCGLGLLLGLLVAFAVLMRKMSSGGPLSRKPARPGSVALISSTSVGTRERVVVLEIGDRWIVAGVTPSSINTLAEMARPEQPAASPAPAPAPAFATRLLEAFHKNGNP